VGGFLLDTHVWLWHLVTVDRRLLDCASLETISART